MDLNLEIEKLKSTAGDGRKLSSLSRMAKVAAAALDQAAIRLGGSIFNNPKFARLAGLNRLNQLERDRIFNELILAGVTLVMLTLEAPDLRSDSEMKVYFRSLRDEIPLAHIEYLKQLGIERKHRKLWKKLITMRLEEYEKERLDARSTAMEYESQAKSLTAADVDGIHLYLPPFTVCVGCHHHIFRGKTKGHDLAFKFLMKKLSRFYVLIRANIEGHKITLVIRARMALRHFINDLKDSYKYKGKI